MAPYIVVFAPFNIPLVCVGLYQHYQTPALPPGIMGITPEGLIAIEQQKVR